MVAISEEVQNLLRSIYLHEIADGDIETPVYNKCVDILLKLDKPAFGYLRKLPRYSSWVRAGMFMATINKYDFGFFWNEEEQFVDVVEVFKRIDEELWPILSLMERVLRY